MVYAAAGLARDSNNKSRGITCLYTLSCIVRTFRKRLCIKELRLDDRLQLTNSFRRYQTTNPVNGRPLTKRLELYMR